MNGNLERPALLGIRDHRARIVRRDDCQLRVLRVAKRQLPGVGHGARVERRDLVVGGVGAAEERGRELAVDLLAERRVDARRLEPLPVVAEVLARRAHEVGLFAEQRQRVGDVRGASAAPLVHRVHQEAHAQPVQMLGQDLLGELAGERHQVVVRNRTGHDDLHEVTVSKETRRSRLQRARQSRAQRTDGYGSKGQGGPGFQRAAGTRAPCAIARPSFV